MTSEAGPPSSAACGTGSSIPTTMTEADFSGIVVTCQFCNGNGSVPDVSKWPPQAVCPGCKGAGVHRV